MFDIAFSEILVIGVVALIVIGPERLPKTACTLGHLFGRLQRYVADVKADITREMELDELRKLQQQVQSAAREIEPSVQSAATEMESSVRSVEAQLNEVARMDDLASSTTATVSEVPPALTAPPTPAEGAGTIAPSRQESPRQSELPGLERP